MNITIEKEGKKLAVDASEAKTKDELLYVFDCMLMQFDGRAEEIKKIYVK